MDAVKFKRLSDAILSLSYSEMMEIGSLADHHIRTFEGVPLTDRDCADMFVKIAGDVAEGVASMSENMESQEQSS